MVVKAKDVTGIMEQLAPRDLAEGWDNCGWQVGDPNAPVSNVMLALDITPDAVEEAANNGAQLIICHHPLLLQGIKSIRCDTPPGNLISLLIKSGINVFAAHTNLDSVEGGVNDVLAGVLGLQNIEALRPTKSGRLLKLVVFVPVAHAGHVREALGRAGAGYIGNYSHCTFNIVGTGTFKPMEGANPFIGSPGELEEVEEVRMETIIKVEDAGKVLKAMLEAHPYEEVAYDLYPLENKNGSGGLGRLGLLPEAMPLGELVKSIKECLRTSSVRYGGESDKKVRRVAVCGGSGGDLWPLASQKGADVLVTGDIRYHTARDMLAGGVSFIDAGHFATERVVLPALREKLSKACEDRGLKINITVAKAEKDSWVSV